MTWDTSEDLNENNEESERAVQEGPEFVDIDALQSVESEQIDSIYSEGKFELCTYTK